ncbi:MAG: FAD-binding protein, partial [Candidatus Moranbacteria bacterium]|nr:FAD-binding protein [Candidatus Moranbacteria bacterium]
IHPDLNMRYFLISEALRGEGAILRNRRWEAFLKDAHPMADLAPRDIVSRAIVSEMRKNDVPNVYLDITSKPREFLKNRFPVIYNECMKRGIDIAVNWIPVVPVQHYFMGGIKTDEYGAASIKGLYSCGESACTGVHGANRLASNSLLECLVFGRRCALHINGSGAKPIKNEKISINIKKNVNTVDFETCQSQIRNIMTKKGGIIRNGDELREAVSVVEEFHEVLKNTCLKSSGEIETLNMACVALNVLKAAEKRKISVGAHYRSDEGSEII